MRAVRGVACALLLLPGCAEDRPRPGPVGPNAQARLSVEVRDPRFNATVLAGRSVEVVVFARDLNGLYLTGIGFVARRTQPAETIDSVVVRFDSEAAFKLDTFQLTIPARYITNTHVDIYGLAFGPQQQTRVSEAVSVVVAECREGVPGCQS